jgi:flavodoxin
MKTLCLYYTRTNTTKAAVEHLAKLLEADIAEYTDGKERSGVKGYIGACIDSMKKKQSAITIKGDADFSLYDRVIIGMPIWAEGPCVVGKALINQYKDSLPQDVYYVVTHMAKNGYDAKIIASRNGFIQAHDHRVFNTDMQEMGSTWHGRLEGEKVKIEKNKEYGLMVAFSNNDDSDLAYFVENIEKGEVDLGANDYTFYVTVTFS